MEAAHRAGISKGVIYLYFESREEIFLTLHLQESVHIFGEVKSLLKGDRYSLKKVRDFIVRFFSENEIFMYLGLIFPVILESNVSAKFAFEFKQTIATELDGIARNRIEAEPGLALSAVRSFILRFYVRSESPVLPGCRQRLCSCSQCFRTMHTVLSGTEITRLPYVRRPLLKISIRFHLRGCPRTASCNTGSVATREISSEIEQGTS